MNIIGNFAEDKMDSLRKADGKIMFSGRDKHSAHFSTRRKSLTLTIKLADANHS
jgi:hypothetical protein